MPQFSKQLAIENIYRVVTELNASILNLQDTAERIRMSGWDQRSDLGASHTDNETAEPLPLTDTDRILSPGEPVMELSNSDQPLLLHAPLLIGEGEVPSGRKPG